MLFSRVLAILLLGCCSACDSRGGVETRQLLSGDSLRNEYRLKGGGLLGEYTRSATLSIRWAGSGQTEKITDWGDLLGSSKNVTLYSDARHYALVIGKYLLHRNRSKPAEWTRWFLGATPKLHAYIKDFLDRTHPQSYLTAKDSVEYIVVGRGTENYEHGWAIRPDGGWLPYEIASVDFENSRITAKLVESSRLLPRVLVYSAGRNSFGDWILDESLTNQANNAQ